MPSGNDYLKELKKRAKESRVYKEYQLDGLEIAQLLKDEKHKSLYIKLAKEGDAQKLRRIAKTIAENKNIRNKGAYFMWQLKSWKQQFTSKNRNPNKRNNQAK
jgi:hypothetical protein